MRRRTIYPEAVPICSLCGEPSRVSTAYQRGELVVTLCGLCAGQQLGELLAAMTAAERAAWFATFPTADERAALEAAGP